MAIWDDVLTGQDRDVYEAVVQPRELGVRPAVVVIDVNYAFVGFKPEPLMEAIKTYATSCGEVGWQAIPRIRTLADAARTRGVPVFYSTATTTPFRARVRGAGIGWGLDGGGRTPLHLSDEAEFEHRRRGNEIVAELGREPQDILIEKSGASVLLGTPLVSCLNDMGVDTLLLAGTTTSGCVRATAVDASNLNLYTAVIEDCTFDRFTISHKVSLMDMHLKYAKVMSLTEGLQYLETGAQPALAVAP